MKKTGLPAVVEEVAMIIGVNAALDLAQVYEGQVISFPSRQRMARLSNKTKVIELHKQGLSSPTIASRTGVGYRTVRRYVTEHLRDTMK